MLGAALLVAVLGIGACTSSDGEPPGDRKATSGQHLTVVEPGWSAFRMFLEPTDSVQVVALTLTNVSASGIELDEVRPLDSQNASIERIEIIGPQSPSLVYRVLEGRPPRHPDHQGQPVVVHRLDEFVMPPREDVAATSPSTADQRNGGSPDGPTDASVLVTYRRTDSLGVSYLHGFEVTYHLVDMPERTYVLDVPDVRVGSCVKGGETFGAECGD